MNIALIGYGRMGKEVERVAIKRGVEVVGTFTGRNNPGGIGLNKDSLAEADVCIDFSTPAVVIDNIDAVAGCGKNMVVGTTGWYDRMDHVKQIVKRKRTGFLHASNFSLGVNLLSQLVLDAAHLFDPYPEYDVSVSEVHHRGKLDSPSGTALSLGSVILRTMKRKTELLRETAHGEIKEEQLHVTSTRVGNVPGKHSVLFDSEYDSLELIHTAKSRTGFALGAIVAAEWLNGKEGFFTMRDVLLS